MALSVSATVYRQQKQSETDKKGRPYIDINQEHNNKYQTIANLFVHVHKYMYLCTVFETNTLLFIRLVVNRFKVKIMLLDFQTMALPISIAIASVLSLITLTDISSR